jgi:hypothetical protein
MDDGAIREHDFPAIAIAHADDLLNSKAAFPQSGDKTSLAHFHIFNFRDSS